MFRSGFLATESWGLLIFRITERGMSQALFDRSLGICLKENDPTKLNKLIQ